MPYILQPERERFDDLIEELSEKIVTVGQLNYVISKLIRLLIKNKSSWYESYHTYNKIIGVLECVKLELYRRDIADYERIKIEENGDI